jgi:hypothetical protein
LQKLLEIEAANRAEADALVRLAGVGASGDSGLASPNVGPGSAAAAVNPSLLATDEAAGKEPTDGSDANAAGQSRPLKRRNPFTRAVHAIRKRFARPQPSDQPVPVAA